jgi:hypothetical protein
MGMSLLTNKFTSGSSLFKKMTLSKNIKIEMLEPFLSNWYHTKKHIKIERASCEIAYFFSVYLSAVLLNK